jgi:hypothetical protein
MSGKRVRHRARRRAAPVVAAVVLTGVGSAWALSGIDPGPGPERGALSAEDATPSASGNGSPSPSASPATPGRRASARAERPGQIRLPSGTVVDVEAVSTRADGSLAIPDDNRVAGWWRGGSRIGDPFGATLIAAHIDSTVQGLGPYAELLGVQPRARIVVRTATQRQAFRVTSLQVVPRDRLAGATDLFSVSGPRRLVMVTCAGPFDADHGGYQNLAVVTARPAGPPVRTTSG